MFNALFPKKRGVIPLKIATSFFVLEIIYVSLMKIYNPKEKEQILLFFFALFYIFYLIYNSFKTSPMDKIIKAPNKEYIIFYSEKSKKVLQSSK